MARRYEEPVQVRTRAEGDRAVPGSFLWRGRLYVVREVSGRWCERGAWWVSAAARAVHGEAAIAGIDAGAGAGADAGAGYPAEEYEVWRVEASRGRAFTSGVYDLVRQGAGGHSEPAAARWRLRSVAD